MNTRFLKACIWVLSLCSMLCFTACKDNTALLPNVSGASYEILIVMDNNDWKNVGGRAVYDMFDQSVPMLPQSEPMFKISRIEHANFTNMLKTSRNIFIAEVDESKYTQTKLHYYNSRWARSQAVAVVTTPCTDSLESFIHLHQNSINNYFVNAELKRQLNYYHKSRNVEAEAEIKEMFGVEMVIPSFLKISKKGKDFFWISNGNLDARQDIVVYAVPYTNINQWELPQLMDARDSVMKINLPGSVKGSYMGIEREVLPPMIEIKNVDNTYCTYVRGLWKMVDGQIMGGPYVSQTRLDERSGRLITVEGFVFAPGRDKRNLLRQLEAVLMSSTMPSETEAVVISNK